MPQDLPNLLDNIRRMADEDDLAAVIVHLNDTYVIEESERRLPGMARVATVVDMVRAEVVTCTGTNRTLVLHSGDFMMPSRRGLETQGAAMTRMLSQFVDVVALGNHEFDLGTQALADRLQDLAQRGVRVVCSNTFFPTESFLGVHPEPVIYWPTEDDPLFAILGVMGAGIGPKKAKFEPSRQAVQAALETGLRGARRLIVLSHDDRTQDLELLGDLDQRLNSRPGFAYLLGGHDHHVDWSQRYVGQSSGRTVFSKCRSNGRSLRIFLLSRSQLMVDELRRLARCPDAPTKASVVESLAASKHLGSKARAVGAALERAHSPLELEEVFKQTSVGCDVGVRLGFDAINKVRPAEKNSALAASLVGVREPRAVLIKRTTAIDVTDESTRQHSTAFGRFVAQCVRAGTKADFAIIHAGSFRGDDYLGPDVDNHLFDDVFIYDKVPLDWKRTSSTLSSIMVATLDTNVVRALLKHGREHRRGQGGFPQTPEDHEQHEEELLARNPQLRVAIASFLVCCEHDGYRAILESQLGRDALLEHIDEWAEETWSIVDLVRANWECAAATLDEDPGPIADDNFDEACISFCEVCAPMRAYFGTRPSRVFGRVHEALSGRNYESSVTWRELDDYCISEAMPEHELASRCVDLLRWWGRWSQEWCKRDEDPIEELRRVRTSVAAHDEVIGDIAEGLVFHLEETAANDKRAAPHG
jgi:hypothetical protein